MNTQPSAVNTGGVFVSYSHRDKRWLARLRTMLQPLLLGCGLSLWDDSMINAGDDWLGEIKAAIDAAAVGVLLVSPDFLASSFIIRNEVLPLLRAAEDRGLKLLWIPVRPFLFEETEIAKFHAASNPCKPLSTIPTAKREIALVEICNKIKNSLAVSNADVDPVEVIPRRVFLN